MHTPGLENEPAFIPLHAPPVLRWLERPAAIDLDLDAQTEACWSRRCAANPRLHDAPIVGVLAFDDASITGVAETYRRLAVADEVPTGVTALGVTGVLHRTDPTGAHEILFARRSAATRLYARCWETAPRGGMPLRLPLTIATLLDQLDQELLEELGPNTVTPSSAWRVLGLVHDPFARSLDVVFARGVDDNDGPKAAAGWEYDALCWLTPEQALATEGKVERLLSPPCRSLLRALMRDIAPRWWE